MTLEPGTVVKIVDCPAGTRILMENSVGEEREFEVLERSVKIIQVDSGREYELHDGALGLVSGASDEEPEESKLLCPCGREGCNKFYDHRK
jgi:hypothetical protein